MNHIESSSARAVADLADGLIIASVEVAAPTDAVFRALSTHDIVDWWIRPGVFDTREWSGDAVAGGRWTASGVGNGKPYALEGEFLEVVPAHKLVHTWRTLGDPGRPTTVAYLLDSVDGGTRITLRHAGFDSRQQCLNTCLGWETSFARLAQVLAAPAPSEV